MYNPFSLDGKTILITGAASGIGLETAVQCSKMGANIVATDIDSDKLDLLPNMLEKSNGKHTCIPADLTNEDDIVKLVSSIDKIDGCVNNAGINKRMPIHFFNEKDINKIYSVNVVAPMMLTKLLVKNKKFNKSASIVFTSSIGGVFTVTNGSGIYGTSKCAINGYMKYAALELAPKGIRCNSVNPGMVNTRLIDADPNDVESDLVNYPLKRYGEPTDIAFAIIYLLSDAASWITGTELKIDGGRTLK